MGGSSSKSTVNQNITNSTINKSVLNNLNETIMNASYNTLYADAKNCSSSVSQNNVCKTGDIDAKGPVKIGGDMKNTSKVNFSCVTDSKSVTNMSSAMVQDLVAEMQSLNGTSAAASLNAAADASNKTGSFTTGGGSSSSNANTNVSNIVSNETISNIQNVFETNLDNNFTSETLAQCIGRVDQTNTIEYGDIKTDSTVDVNCILSNDAEVIQNCKLLSESINTSLVETATALGMTVVTESQTTAETEATTTSSSENVSTGLIQDMGSAISSIVSSLGDLFTGLGLAMLAPYAGSICCVCCIIILLSLGLMAFKMMGGNASETAESMGIDTSKFSSFDSSNPFGSSNPAGSNPFGSNPVGGGIYSITDMYNTDLSITSTSFA